MSNKVHYEVFFRKSINGSWSLQMATEKRADAIALAEEGLESKAAIAVRVSRETMDVASGEFTSLMVLSRGVPIADTTGMGGGKERRKAPEHNCTSPQDLYTHPAREVIGRLFDDWFRRTRTTPYELLHRPDLADMLDSSGIEIQHAIQKIAVPEAQDMGGRVHDIVRRWQGLADRAIEQLVKDGRANRFPKLDLHEPNPAGLQKVLAKISKDSNRPYVFGGVLCQALIGIRSWKDKFARIDNLLRSLPEEKAPRNFVLTCLDPLLSELLVQRVVLNELMGKDQDSGGQIMLTLRLVAPLETLAISRVDAKVAHFVPRLPEALAEIGRFCERGELKMLSTTLARYALNDLAAGRRLRPSDTIAEIEVMRIIAMIFTACNTRLSTGRDVASVFSERSRALVSADFVNALTHDCKNALEEAERLLWLCENVTGSSNKREASRWLSGIFYSHRYERDLRGSDDTPQARLTLLAEFQRRCQKVEFSEKEGRELRERIGEIGHQIEQEAKIIQQVVRSKASVVNRLSMLLRFAGGQIAPVGPISLRAKQEAARLLKQPDLRQVLMQSPDLLQQLKPLMQAAGFGGSETVDTPPR